MEINLECLPSNPGLRKKIFINRPNYRDRIRRHYLQQGLCQSKGHDFPKKKIDNIYRRFVPKWFVEHGNWLEYGIPNTGAQPSGEVFVSKEYSNWKKKEKFNEHRGPESAHNKAWRSCEDLMKQ